MLLLCFRIAESRNEVKPVLLKYLVSGEAAFSPAELKDLVVPPNPATGTGPVFGLFSSPSYSILRSAYSALTLFIVHSSQAYLTL